MAEVGSWDGKWTFDGETLRITPGQDGRVHKLRRKLGTLAVPLAALTSVSYEPGRKNGALRAKVRDGADPFTVAVAGQLSEYADPFRLTIEPEQVVDADYLVDATRFAPRPPEHTDGPVDRFLLPSPALPVSASTSEAAVSFDGRVVRIEWGWQAPESKRRAGTQELAIGDITGVQWRPQTGLTDGVLRFEVGPATQRLMPSTDLYSVRLKWGTENEALSALVAVAVVACLPHPYGKAENAAAPAAIEPSIAGDDLDVHVQRLRQLGELHSTGVLSADEFTAAKQVVLRKMSEESTQL